MPAPVPVGVLVSGAGSNLQALLDTVHGREAQVVAVASSHPGAGALERARRAGVDAAAFPLDEHPTRDARDRAIAEFLVARGVRLVVLAGYMQILGGELLGRFPGAVINVHPSLLPSFPGLAAPQQALDHGVRVTGVTVHFVDEGVDTGPIILQRALEVRPGEDAAALHDRLRALEHEALPEVVRLYAAGRLAVEAAHPRRVVIAPA